MDGINKDVYKNDFSFKVNVYTYTWVYGILMRRYLVSEHIVDDAVDAVIISGGTGITGSDGTPEAVIPLLDKIIDGFGEIFRLKSYEKIKTSSLQSRAVAGVANKTFIFVLPGSTDACITAWEEIISHQLNSDTKPCNLVMLMPRLNE